MRSKCGDWYDRNALAYCAKTVDIDISETRQKFARLVPSGGRILDAGCGSGRDSKWFREAGFVVDAIDRSAAMAAEAHRLTGVEVRVGDILELTGQRVFDGIWACASLVHLADPEFGSAMSRMSEALRQSGVLYLSVKERTDPSSRDGRWFREWTQSDIKSRVDRISDLSLIECWMSRDSASPLTTWINVLARRR